MSRMARYLKEDGCYYVRTKSYKYQKIFKMNSDYERYIQVLKKYKMRFQIKVYAYCLMPKSAHLIVYPKNSYTLPLFMQGINQSYALFFNAKYNGIGKVWGQRYKSILIKRNYDLFASIKSVEFIPVRERCIRSPVDYPWSSCMKRVLGFEDIIDPISSSTIHLNEFIY